MNRTLATVLLLLSIQVVSIRNASAQDTAQSPAQPPAQDIAQSPAQSPAQDIAQDATHATAQAPAVVEVIVTFQEYDPFFPWQSNPAQERRGFGLMLDSSRILTAEMLTRNQALIEIRRPRAGRKETARLIQADPQIGLALLQLESPEGPGVPPLEPVPPSGGGPAVEIVQITPNGDRQQGGGRVVQWKVDDLPDSPYSALLATILTDLNIDGTGAPVFSDGRFAGLVLSYNAGTRTAQMLPAQAVHAFIADVGAPPYRGFAFAGFSWQPLIDAAKRRYFGIPGGTDGGIQVLGVLPATAAGSPLEANDIILAWDGFPIDSQGYYMDPDFGRLRFTHLIKGRHKPGDTVPVSLIRRRETVTIQVTLGRFDDELLLIPENPAGLPEAFLVDGGFVIRELTGRMLKAVGNQWTVRTDPRLAHLYLTRQTQPEVPGDRVVFLAAVLPDPINIGYQHLREEIIETVNGVPVRHLGDVLAAADRDGGIRRLGLRGTGVEIAIAPEELAEANKRIATQYRIPFMRRAPAPPPPR
jgi:S1-C subfamily serine protease